MDDKDAERGATTDDPTADTTVDRVLWSCVTEDRPDWHDRVTNLVLSIRMFGGAHAEDPVVVNVVGSCDPDFRAVMEGMDADVRIVERVHPECVYANKLRMLELAGHQRAAGAEVLMALDCDVLVLGDPSPRLTASAVCVKPADVDALPEARWQAMYEALGMPLPARSYVATTTGTPMVPYFNSGVVLVPMSYAPRLLDSWLGMIDTVLDLYRTHPDVVPARKRFYVDQYALALALESDGMGVRPLPVTYNLPLNLPTHRALRSQVLDPVIVHYHKNRDADGFMYASPVSGEVVNPRLDAFNRERARRFGQRYEGLQLPPPRKLLRRRAVRYRTAALDLLDRARIAVDARTG